jgi:hypothetical protein
VTNVLILGANGQLARNTTRVFLRDTDATLTLYLRRASEVSLNSLSDLIVKLAVTPEMEIRRSLGVSRG